MLAESTRLHAIADLVGITALPTEERLTLLAALLVSEALLQQSALSSNDASCQLAKQTALARAVLDVHDTALALGQDGVPASVIEAFDYGPLIRAKDNTGPGDADGVTQIAADLIAAMKRLVP
jgi:V/A-type H+-transporting ATPase subunit A